MAEHYYTEKQTSPFKLKKMLFRTGQTQFELYTAGGVFSPKKIDIGTMLLIDSAFAKKGWKILDLGCGYGAVGIAIKKRNPDCDVFMSDVNERAVMLSKMNVQMNKLEIEVFQSDFFKNSVLSKMHFNSILLNPPQTAGKEVCFRMIEESKQHIVEHGFLQIVARSQKGGKQLSRRMEEVFGNVSVTAKRAGYRVYTSQKTDKDAKK